MVTPSCTSPPVYFTMLSMDQWLKFYKEHDVSIYHEGYVYVFHRELDSLKPDDNPELRSSYHCSHNYNSLNKCHARVYTTGNWEIDKRGRGYQWGMFRKERHNHEPHHKDTIQRQKFYKHDETTLLRDGFFYTFYRGLDILKPGVDPQWRSSYHCIHSEDGLLCRGRIHTTGEWKTTKRDRTFQWGVFKNVNHNHDPDTDDDGKALASTSKCELQSRETEYHAGNMENYEGIYESNQVYGSITKERKSKKHERDIQNEADETGISLPMDRTPAGTTRKNSKRVKTKKQLADCTEATQISDEKFSGIFSPLGPSRLSRERIKTEKQTYICADPDTAQTDCEELSVKFLGYEDIDDQKWVPVGMLNCTDMILEYERSRNEDVKVVDKRVKDGIAQYKVKKKNRQRHFWASASDLEPYRILILKFEKSLEDKAKFCDAAIVSKSGLTHSTPTATKRSFPRISDAPKSKSPKMKEKSFNDVPFNISTGTITKSCIPVPSYRKLAIFNKC
ncbi:hypothetical protein Ddc_00294 [Ditylenchus destructor]|nr:hypothetical protein Ddc_00294 [Ditylenchus destructor]